MPARAHAPRQPWAGRQQPLCGGGATWRPPAHRRFHTGTARMSTSVQAAAQAQQPDAAPHCKAPQEAARKAKPAARRGGLRPGAVPPSAWDLRGVAVYAAFLAAAGAYFWLRAEGVCAMGPYAWCARTSACHGHPPASVLGGRLAALRSPAARVQLPAYELTLRSRARRARRAASPFVVHHATALSRDYVASILLASATYVCPNEQCALCRYGALVLAGEALGACSVVLYGLCIIRAALPSPALGMQPATDGADQAFHVQACTH